MVKILFDNISLVYLIAILELLTHCQCIESATNQTNINKSNATQIVQSRRLIDDNGSISSYSNGISDTNLSIGEQLLTDNFPYYTNEPIEITTPAVEIIKVPMHEYSNHQPVHQMDLAELSQQSIQFLPSQQHHQQHELDTYSPGSHLQSLSPTHQLVKVTREPFWASDVITLENQYLDTFRGIKSSVMNFYYKMQDFVSYIMSFFSLGKQFSKIIYLFFFLH